MNKTFWQLYGAIIAACAIKALWAVCFEPQAEFYTVIIYSY